MKTIKVTLIFLALAVLILFTSQSALADSEVAKLEGFLTPYVVKDAPGTKLSGTLTIYYEKTGSLCGNNDPFNPLTNMYFFMRLKKVDQVKLTKVDEPYGFSGAVQDICYQSFDDQYAALSNFITKYVIPNVFFNKPKATFKLKSVSNFAQDDQAVLWGSPFFAMMDIELAVQE
jgi:hypothetical protein